MSAGPDLLRLRRGVGVIYMISGALHAGTMVFAALYSLGRLHITVPVSVWRDLYFAQFLFLVMGSILYLAMGFRQTGVFYYEVLADFLVGVAAFVVVMSVVGTLLAAGRLHPWFSLSISAFLGLYGAGLYSGRAFGAGRRPEGAPKP